MKIYLEKIIFVNRAPFENLDLNLYENDINVLMAVNGSGKTTILSHITDAFYEMAKPHFQNEFEENQNKYYRVSSNIYNLNFNNFSLVYFRFITPEGKIDYIDVRNQMSSADYDRHVQLDDKIPYNEINGVLVNATNVKKVSKELNKDSALKIFNNNVLTFYPSYRYENPGYLNQPYEVKLEFKKSSGFAGYLNNPLEVITGLPELANWIMDIVLDMRMNQQLPDLLIFNNLNNIISQTLKSKGLQNCRFGVGPRGYGNTRIQIVENQGKQVYPNIFNLSSGESSLLCIFGEILRQADNNISNTILSHIHGIVLIDEIDKHLHISLQKEVLPELLRLFPNIQFILSSHSPFLSMGLAEKLENRSKIIDLDNFGITKDPSENKMYEEVYEMMINENKRFKNLYQNLESSINNNNKTLIITEGKTDIQHIRKSAEILGSFDFEVEYFNAESDSKLLAMLEQLSKLPRTRKIIGIFDRDVPKTVSKIEKNGNTTLEYGNNVYAFCLPIPEHREGYTNVSIEFYYPDKDLKKPHNGKCLYFSNELNFNSNRKPISPINEPEDDFDKKIWCENIGDLEWIHSKSRFADLVEDNPEFVSNFNFDSFKLVHEKIEEINAA
ncbi:Predicted ATP-binding protein involved in virulence [Salinimicrobium catena]|uniref:Predicted ATP-binding protein involved in virulence n=1 Tax=Salinimicrobium catena TaxID=390640 RepID=A0A1H5MVT1_9FLAO|nr:AAA family ATPase [Salinimicrobium catena]SDL30891.1 Predicted ATP-binding protein involved in virulence [Salinimicrobium catena]SEE93469.1 Predicted ATP-binding protein involved in virulence [Salinimicrobium catena]